MAGNRIDNAAEMLRDDLEAAGIPYAIDGPDGPLYADIHSLRHSYVALLDRAGLTLKVAMQLARHSDPKLTKTRYGRAQLHDLGAAVESMPPLLGATGPAQEAARATGTGPVCTGFVQTADSGRDSLRLADTATGDGGDDGGGPKLLTSRPVETNLDSVGPDERSAPCRTRTYNPLIKSQLLCQLS